MTTTSKRGPFSTVAEIKAANRELGGHFFDADAMRFFGSKVGQTVIGGRFFITSEQLMDDPRRYTVRAAHDDGTICTVGTFCAMQAHEAKRYARDLWERMVAGETVTCNYGHTL